MSIKKTGMQLEAKWRTTPATAAVSRSSRRPEQKLRAGFTKTGVDAHSPTYSVSRSAPTPPSPRNTAIPPKISARNSSSDSDSLLSLTAASTDTNVIVPGRLLLYTDEDIHEVLTVVGGGTLVQDPLSAPISVSGRSSNPGSNRHLINDKEVYEALAATVGTLVRDTRLPSDSKTDLSTTNFPDSLLSLVKSSAQQGSFTHRRDAQSTENDIIPHTPSLISKDVEIPLRSSPAPTTMTNLDQQEAMRLPEKDRHSHSQTEIGAVWDDVLGDFSNVEEWTTSQEVDPTQNDALMEVSLVIWRPVNVF